MVSNNSSLLKSQDNLSKQNSRVDFEGFNERLSTGGYDSRLHEIRELLAKDAEKPEDDPDKYVSVDIDLDDAECIALMEKCDSLGITVNEFMWLMLEEIIRTQKANEVV